MGNPIVKLEGKYLIWSTVSDSPVTYGMTLDELISYVRDEDGWRGVKELGPRVERADAKGTSSFDDQSADDTIWLNRAGPGEQPLHREEIVEFYVRRQEDPTEATLTEFRRGLERCGPTCPSIVDEFDCTDFCPKCWGTDFVRPLPETSVSEGKK